jgi:hypothetical protein
LRIKALALLDSDETAGGEALLRRIVTDYADSWTEVAFAHERLGDLCRSRGALDEAEREYRASLATSPSLSGTSGEVHLSLAEVVLARGDTTAVPEALSLLEAARPHMNFNSSIFRWHVLGVRLAEAQGNREAARSQANAALALVDAPPQFSRHPDVGLAIPDDELVSELQRLASA